MGIVITAENVGDAMSKLHRDEPHYAIRIRWRKDDWRDSDFRPAILPGCIVNAVGLPGQEVERSFPSASEAMRYIASLLKSAEDHAKQKRREREKALRASAKKAKAGCK